MHENPLIVLMFTGAIAITGGQFSNDSLSVVVGQVECVGNETSLVECAHENEKNHQDVKNCDQNEIAGVTCQGSVTKQRILESLMYLFVHRSIH